MKLLSQLCAGWPRMVLLCAADAVAQLSGAQVDRLAVKDCGTGVLLASAAQCVGA